MGTFKNLYHWLVSHVTGNLIVYLQVGVWALYFRTMWMGNRALYPHQSTAAVVAIFILILLVFYAIVGFLYVLFHRRYWWIGLLLLLVFFLLASWFTHTYVYHWLPRIGIHIPQGDHPLDRAFLSRMWVEYKYFVVCAMLFFVFIKYREIVRQQHQRELALERLEREKLELEYEALVNQNQPHMLYNFLNMLYNDIQGCTDKWDGLLPMLSEYTRYANQHALRRTQKVAIERELEQIKRLLALQEARFEGKFFVELHIPHAPKGHRIMPIVLITLVENAMKYGVYFDPDDPIRIDLRLDQDGLHFRCRNRINPSMRKTESTGVGLSNLRRRLEIIYGEDVLLKVSNDGTYFTVELRIHQ